MTKRTPILLFFILMVFFLTSCTGTEAAAPTSPPTDTPTLTLTPTFTLVPTPTFTPTSTPIPIIYAEEFRDVFGACPEWDGNMVEVSGIIRVSLSLLCINWKCGLSLDALPEDTSYRSTIKANITYTTPENFRENTMLEMPNNYSRSDLKIMGDDGELIYNNDVVRVTGTLDCKKKTMNYYGVLNIKTIVKE